MKFSDNARKLPTIIIWKSSTNCDPLKRDS